jgi:nucleotide-binding universal stress UspA family protein
MEIFRAILVPVDFSRHAAAALRVAVALARRHHGRIVALHVVPPYEGPSEKRPGWRSTASRMPHERKRLAAAVGKVAGRGRPRVECRVVAGAAVDGILDAARDVDSIVMATAGRTGFRRLLMGSTAEKVVRQAPVPVLTVRPGAARRVAAADRGSASARTGPGSRAPRPAGRVRPR